jgi:hypothetical protein
MAPRDSSCAGSTRASIKRLFKKMDCRVKPRNDDYYQQYVARMSESDIREQR